jgi:hypothetical protein
MMKYLLSILIGLAAFGSANSAFAWNPLEKKQCSKQTTLKSDEYKKMERRLSYRDGWIGGAIYHQLGGSISCNRLNVHGKDGKTKGYSISWVIEPNRLHDLTPVRVLDKGEGVSLECTCERIEGLGECVGYFGYTGLPECK